MRAGGRSDDGINTMGISPSDLRGGECMGNVLARAHDSAQIDWAVRAVEAAPEQCPGGPEAERVSMMPEAASGPPP